MNTTSEYVTGMQAQLKAWDANVDVLLTESRKADGEARTAYAKRLKELRLSRKAAQKSLEALRAATGATAAKTQAAMQETWDSMQKSLEKVSTELRDMTRVAPSAATHASAGTGGTAASRASATPPGDRTMSHTQTEVTKERLYGEFEAVVAETEQLLKSIAGASGDKAVALKASVEQGLAAASERLARIREASLSQAGAAARATDEYVHDNPWRAVGFVAAAGTLAGLIAGLMIARR